MYADTSAPNNLIIARIKTRRCVAGPADTTYRPEMYIPLVCANFEGHVPTLEKSPCIGLHVPQFFDTESQSRYFCRTPVTPGLELENVGLRTPTHTLGHNCVGHD